MPQFTLNAHATHTDSLQDYKDSVKATSRIKDDFLEKAVAYIKEQRESVKKNGCHMALYLLKKRQLITPATK